MLHVHTCIHTTPDTSCCPPCCPPDRLLPPAAPPPRYLEKAVFNLDLGQLKLVLEALAERKAMIDNAPHLSGALPILMVRGGTAWVCTCGQQRCMWQARCCRATAAAWVCSAVFVLRLCLHDA
jgi:hypothetical protein